MSDVPTKHFKKEILSNKVWLPSGKSPQWEPIGNDTGVLATNDANLIFHLTNLAHKQVGGVVAIDAAEYDAIKKNSTGPASPPPSPREMSGPVAAPTLAQLLPRHPPVKPLTPAAAPAAPVVAEPAAPPPAPQKVRVGRIKRAPAGVPSQLP